ncbi:hypothetical protein HDV05_007179 [Chytridiales sp. JEL 0842]|nr:hypothetical protein HDV05_007179 [Chytridiales sp. JEL 0842]
MTVSNGDEDAPPSAFASQNQRHHITHPNGNDQEIDDNQIFSGDEDDLSDDLNDLNDESNMQRKHNMYMSALGNQPPLPVSGSAMMVNPGLLADSSISNGGLSPPSMFDTVGRQSTSSSMLSETTISLLSQAEENMSTLVNLVSDLSRWKPVLTHNRSGAVVYRRTSPPSSSSSRTASSDSASSTSRDPVNSSLPIFMGVGVIKGFDPETIIALVQSRSLWDDWYHDGHLVERINESTSISYMVMEVLNKAIVSHRDLALLEKKEVDPNTGTIRLVTSSVKTPKVPVHPQRVRAHLQLNGWILDPLYSPDRSKIVSTRVSYILQTDVKGLVPSGLAKRYLARRALVMVWLDNYLRKYGPPPVHAPRSSYLGQSATSSNFVSADGRESFVTANRDSILTTSTKTTTITITGDERPHSQEPSPHVEQLQAQNTKPEPTSPSSVSFSQQPEKSSTPLSTAAPVSVVANTAKIVPQKVQKSKVGTTITPFQNLPAPTANPHLPVAHSALSYLQAVEPLSGWTPHSTSPSGIRIATRPVQGSQMDMVRGDARFDFGKLIETYNCDTALSYSAQKGTFPVAGRDFCTILHTHYTEELDGSLYYLASSVEDPRAPLDPKKVRAELKVAGWILKASGTTNEVEVSYIVQVDVKGSIPSSLVKAIQTSTPLAIAEVQKYLDTHGPHPHVIKHMRRVGETPNITLTKDEFTTGGKWEVEFRVVEPQMGGRVAVYLPEKVYGFRKGWGVGVSLQPEEGFIVKRVEGLESLKKGEVVVFELEKGRLEVGCITLKVVVKSDSNMRGVVVSGEDVQVVLVDDLEDLEASYDIVDEQENDDDEPATQDPTASISLSSVVSTLSLPTHPPLQVQAVEKPVLKVLPPIVTPDQLAKLVAPIPHAHSAKAAQALTLLKSLEPLEGWETLNNINGVQVSTRPVPGSSMGMVRGDGIIEGWTTPEVLSVIKSFSARQTWDARFEGGNLLKTFSIDESLAHTFQKGTFPVAGRDLLSVSRTEFNYNDTTYHVSTSVVDPACPEDSKRVRANLTLAGWILQPQNNNPSVLKVTYIVQVDPKGTLPAALIKAVQAQTPLAVGEIRKYLESVGPSPVLVRGVKRLEPSANFRMVSETPVDRSKGVWAVDFEWVQAELGGSLGVLLVERVFGAGVDISIDLKTKEDRALDAGDLEVLNLSGPTIDDLRGTGAVGKGYLLVLKLKRAVVKEGETVSCKATFRAVKTGLVTLRGDVIVMHKLAGDVVEVNALYGLDQPRMENGMGQAATLPPQHTSLTVGTSAITASGELSSMAPTSNPTSPTLTKSPTSATSPVAPRPPAYIPHRHTETGVRALRLVKKLMSDGAAWVPTPPELSSGIRLWTIDVEGNTMPMVKAESIFSPGWTPEEIVAVIKSTGARKTWDCNFEDAEMKEWLNPNECILHSIMKAKPPLGTRDVAVLQVSIFDASSMTNFLIHTSVDDALIPATSAYTRAHVSVAGWIIRPSCPPNPPGTLVTQIISANPGDMPAAVSRIQALRMGMNVQRVQNYLNEFGVPVSVKVLGNTGEGLKVHISDERFVHSDTSYTVCYLVSNIVNGTGMQVSSMSGFAGMVEVNVCRSMYPQGVDVIFDKVEVNGVSKKWDEVLQVRAAPDGKSLRFYPKHEIFIGACEAKLQIHIAKRRCAEGGSRQFTIGGVMGIVLADKSNKPGVGGGKRNLNALAAAPNSRRPSVLPTSPTTVSARATIESAKPSSSSSSSSRGFTQSPAAVSKVLETSPATTHGPPAKEGTNISDNERSVILATLLAIAAIILKALLPIIGGKRGDVKNGPLEPMTLFEDATPAQLTIILVGGTLVSVLVLLSVAPSLLGIFGFLQWIIVLSLVGLSMFLGAKLK